MKICRTATVPFMLLNHLKAQIAATVAAGHQVTLVCSDGPEVERLREVVGVTVVLITIPRTISPLRDLLAFFKLFMFFLRNDFDVVHSTTPKAGLLSMSAAWFARIPIRLHTFTGQPWVELRGLKRQIVKRADWVTAHLSTMNYADSRSQQSLLIAERVVVASNIRTLGAGSLAGIDLERFSPAKWRTESMVVRRELGVSENWKVVVFVGRLTRDKGVVELVNAFEQLREQGIQCKLLLVGPLEQHIDPLPAKTLDVVHSNCDIHHVGYVAQPEKYLAVADVLCLPSYREGFGTVILEAAAMSVPTVATDIVGIRDAVIAGATGLLVPPKNAPALVEALRTLLGDDGLRKDMGRAAQQRCIQEFDAQQMHALIIAEYVKHQ
jgi:glycosyltransferase involved in cell wall biosynthesis